MKFLSILNDVPAKAATPKGFSFKLSKLLKNLFLSLLNFLHKTLSNVQKI